MNPIEQLKAEHEGIKLMLSILEKICDKLDNGQKVEPEHLSQVLEFLRVFADKCHHGKEEDLLFPALEQAGVPQQGGPIGVMLIEHTEGRGYIKGLAGAIDRYKGGDENASAEIVENARNYIDLLRQHIYKENNVLFMMAQQVLSEETQKKLAEAFEKMETEKIGAGKHEEFHKLMHRLKEIYLK